MLKIKGHLFFSSVIVLGLACFVPPRELRCMLGSKPGFCFSNYTEKKTYTKDVFPSLNVYWVLQTMGAKNSVLQIS